MSTIDKWKTAYAQLTVPGAPFELAEHHGMPLFRHAPATLNDALEAGRRHGDASFVTYLGKQLSFNGYFAEVERVAAGLIAQGLARGMRVAIAMRNRPEWLVAFHAVLKAGAVPCALNSWWQGEELAHAIADGQASWLIADGDRLARLEGRLGGLTVVGVDGAAALDMATPAGPVPDAWPQVSPDDIAAVLFTSGTSARAKAVVLSQRALAQGAFNFDFFAAVGAMAQPALIARAAGRRIRSLLAVPLFHVSGLMAQFVAGLRGGRELVLMHKWDADEAIRELPQDGITTFNGSPAMQVDLISHPSFDASRLGHLLALGYGGAGVPESLSGRIARALPEVMQGVGYGMTETGGAGCVNSGELFFEHPQASGLVSPIMQVRAMAPDGTPCPPGVEGELAFFGVTLMDGYWQDGQLDRSSFNGAWFATGDIGVVDADGLVRLTGRSKEVVNRGGEKFSLSEVEHCLTAHPDVLEAAALAVPDERLGERLEAVVVVRAGAPRDAEAIRAFAAERLAAYKVPASIHISGTALPRNATGKLMRQALRVPV